jgi:RNA polymerase-interacting CarD/CdnL/TRCF family regulator
METQEGLYKEGDWIVHPVYGTGQVIGKVNKGLSGKNQLFYTVKIDDGQYWLAEEHSKSKHVRPLATLVQIEDAITKVQEAPENLPDNLLSEKKRQHLSDESILTKACLIRDLNGKKAASKLSREETAWLRKIKNQFLSEWSMVSDETSNFLGKKLNLALKTSIEKVQS